MKRKVLIFIDSLNAGGMHRQMLHLTRLNSFNEFKIVIMCYRATGAFEDLFRNTNVEIYDLSWQHSASISLIYRIRKLLSKIRPDIVFITEANCFVHYVLANVGLRAKSKLVGSFRSFNFWHGQKSKLHYYTEILLGFLFVHFSTKVIVNSHSLKTYYVSLLNSDQSKFEVIYNSIFSEDKNINNIPKSNKKGVHQFIMISRLSFEKDFETLLLGLKLYKDITNNPFKLLLIGTGEAREFILDYLRKLSLQEYVFLIGHSNEVDKYYTNSDISFLISHNEGMSNTLMESMLYRCPIVASNVPGNMELLGKNNSAGILVEPGNPQAICDAIFSILTNESEAKKRSDYGYSRVIDLCDSSNNLGLYKKLFLSI